MTNKDDLLQDLKNEADVLGVKYSGNISPETLQARIDDFKQELDQSNQEKTKPMKEETAEERNKRLYLEQTKLIRIIVAPMNPSKKEHTAERFTVSNDIMHDSRVIQFHSEWHVTEALANYIEGLRFTMYRDKRNKGAEGSQQEAIESRAYTVTRLPPLTQEELEDIRQRQLADNI